MTDSQSPCFPRNRSYIIGVLFPISKSDSKVHVGVNEVISKYAGENTPIVIIGACEDLRALSLL